jgi:hypothetical protein
VWLTAAASKDVILKHGDYVGPQMWHMVLDLIGGEHADLSSVRDSGLGSVLHWINARVCAGT